MNYFETLVSLSKIVDECEKKLESNATTKKDILDKIEQQLNSVNLFKEEIEQLRKHATLS